MFFFDLCHSLATWAGGNVFNNVSVVGVFVFVSVINVFAVFIFDRFYVIVWQGRQVKHGGNAFNVSGRKR